MNDKEKLIEEAAKADFYASPDDRIWEDVSDKERAIRLRGMAAAVAVFEKAHTPTVPRFVTEDGLRTWVAAPTDDEREALRQEFEYRIRTSVAYGIGRGKPDDYATSEQKAAWIRAEIDGAMSSRAVVGFRRSEVPEPSADLTPERRHALLEGAVDAIERNATNRTHAYNIWNNLASDERFVRAIVAFCGSRLSEPSEDDEIDPEICKGCDELNHECRCGDEVPEPSAEEWAHCSPALFAYGLDCASTARRACACESANGGHDHLVSEPQGEPSDAVANAVARAIIEHDEDRLTCYDHPEDFCCPCGEHGMSRSEWQRHQARAALRAAAAAVTEKEEGKES